MLGVSGAAVKTYILGGRLRAAKAPNGYWWIRREDLEEFRRALNDLEFKYHGSERSTCSRYKAATGGRRPRRNAGKSQSQQSY